MVYQFKHMYVYGEKEHKNKSFGNDGRKHKMKIFFIAVISKKAYFIHNLFINIKLTRAQLYLWTNTQLFRYFFSY